MSLEPERRPESWIVKGAGASEVRGDLFPMRQGLARVAERE